MLVFTRDRCKLDIYRNEYYEEEDFIAHGHFYRGADLVDEVRDFLTIGIYDFYLNGEYYYECVFID
jgi:hypothetical protein